MREGMVNIVNEEFYDAVEVRFNSPTRIKLGISEDFYQEG